MAAVSEHRTALSDDEVSSDSSFELEAAGENQSEAKLHSRKGKESKLIEKFGWTGKGIIAIS